MFAAWALTSSAIAGQAAASPIAQSVETIRFEAWPCWETCPSYVLTISSTGRGTFQGRIDTAFIGKRRFRATPAQFAEFRRRLASLRPTGELRIDKENCPVVYFSDLPSIDIQWSGDGPKSHLHLYFGCDWDRKRAAFEALERAPEALGIKKLIWGS